MNELQEAARSGGKSMTFFGVIAIILGILAMTMPGLTGQIGREAPAGQGVREARRVRRSATAALRGLLSLMALAAALALGSCTTVGPDFVRPQVPWLRDWSGGEWRALADAAPPRAPVPYDEWWRTFGDPVLDFLVAEAQRLNPGVRTAGLRILEARAQLGIAGSALYPQLQQVTAQTLYMGNRDTDGRGLRLPCHYGGVKRLKTLRVGLEPEDEVLYGVYPEPILRCTQDEILPVA